MTYEERLELAERLRNVLCDSLAPKICTGTAQQLRERKHELARLMARITGVILYDGMSDLDMASGTKHLEDEMRAAADKDAHHLWPATAARDRPGQ